MRQYEPAAFLPYSGDGWCYFAWFISAFHGLPIVWLNPPELLLPIQVIADAISGPNPWRPGPYRMDSYFSFNNLYPPPWAK